MVTQTFADLGIDTKGRYAGHVKTKCPQCAANRKPSHRSDTPLSVNLDEGVYLCHNCGFTGSLKRTSWQAQIGNERVYVKPNVSPDRLLGPKARAFLTDRKIDPDIAEETGVYSNPADTAIAFPYFRDGEIVHVKYRAIDEKRFWSTKDTELVMYGLDDCRNAETVIVCEGELDRLALICAGFGTTLSVPNGAITPGTNPGAKLDCMASAENIFANAKKIIIATDGDAPGEALADELKRRIGPDKCWRVKFPDGTKDANDVLASGGVKALCDAIDQSRPTPVVGIYDGDDFEDELIRLHRQGRDKGYSFGYPLLDQYYTVLPGYMTVVTGHAGHGKSTALDQLLVKLAERYDWHIAVFSPEQQPLAWHQAQLIEQYMGFPFWDGPSPRLTEAEMLTANRWVT
ncbi:MAG: toprim domain-containing protein, partial [Thermomicrobiales bacterium]